MKPTLFGISILAGVIAGPALAASAPSPGQGKLADVRTIAASLDGEYLSYSGAFGSRRIVSGTTRVGLGKTNVSMSIAQGTRKAADNRFHATRLTGTLVHEWSARLSTRTSASIASNQPVFVTREALQEVSYKPSPRTVLTVGARYARYFGGLDGTSWSLGAAQYFRGGMVSYRFSAYHTQHLGNTVGHLLNVKLDDRFGSNQLWLGHGTAIHDATWLATPEKGKFSNIELRRVQPVGGGVSVVLGANRTWYNTDSAKYHGTGGRLGLLFTQ